MSELRDNTGRERLTELDAFRGIAAMSVLIFHFTWRYDSIFHPDTWITFEWRYGLVGVQFFFMISGFVIYWSLQRAEDLQGFAVSRAIRLYPAFWISMGLSATILILFPLAGFEISLAQVLVNLTMFQAWVKVDAIDGVYWSLAYELGFYIFMGLAWKVGLLRHIHLMLAGLLIGNALFITAPQLIPHPLHFLLVINQYTHLFVAGIILYRLKESEVSWLDGVLVLATLPLSYYGLGLSNTLFYIGFLAAFYLAIGGHLRFLCTRPLLFLGAISYPLYLLHQMIGFRLIYAALEHGLPPLVAIAAATFGTIALAAFVTYAIERPAMAALKARSQNRRAAGAAP